MNVQQFEKQRGCAKKAQLDRDLVSKNRRNFTVASLLRDISKKILSVPKEELMAQVDEVVSSYEDSWFKYPFEPAFYKEYDKALFERFILFMYSEYGDCEVADVDVECHMMLDELSLSVTVPVVLCRPSNGEYFALKMQFSPHKKASARARTLLTREDTDLANMCIESFCAQKYGNCTVLSVAVRSAEDGDTLPLPPFTEGTAMKHNVHVVRFEKLRGEDGEIDWELFRQTAIESSKAEVATNCHMCPHKDICELAELEDSDKSVYMDVIASENTQVTYTSEQKAVVEHGDGAMAVIAGPGSGKTRVLVGRICRLIEKGVNPYNILTLTFSNKACETLTERLAHLGQIPKVSTLHSLAYEILRANAGRAGRKYVLFPDGERYMLLESILRGFPKVPGVNYLASGDNAPEVQVKRRIDYFNAHTGDEFAAQYPDLVGDAVFAAVASTYNAICEANGYITFDEQIALCVDMLGKYPDVLGKYQKVYTHLLVDEYQDIDPAQARLIHLLSEKAKSVVVAGDDDQAIYGFRKASNRYLKEFKTTFNAKEIVLSYNFRSTKEIVDLSRGIAETFDGIPKNIIAEKDGARPVIVSGRGVAAVERCIRDAIATGYSYGDIAVLAFKNSSLRELYRKLEEPCYLARILLKDTKLVRVADSILKGVLYHEEAALRCYALFMKEDIPDMQSFLSRYAFLVNVVGTEKLVALIAQDLGLLNSSSHVGLNKYLSDHRCGQTPQELSRVLDAMIKYSDETRVDLPKLNAIELITSHDSKGKEYPVVIVADCDDYMKEHNKGQDAPPQEKNVLYVASTRAKDCLYLCAGEDLDTLLGAGYREHVRFA